MTAKMPDSGPPAASEIGMGVIEILAEQALLSVDEVLLDASPVSLGLDSLALVEAIYRIEDRFDVEVPFNANDPEHRQFDVSTVGAIIAAVEALVQDADRVHSAAQGPADREAGIGA